MRWHNVPALFAAESKTNDFYVTVEIGPDEILCSSVGWPHHMTGIRLTVEMSFTDFVLDNEFSSFYQTEGEV